MSRPDWTEIGDLFSEALEQPPGERTRFVRERCRARPDLLVEVNRLLAADQTADAGFLGGIDPAILAGLRAESVPEMIGPYRVLRPIGTGGMGEVFLAERADGQFEHQVAVKLLKRGMDSDAVLARFLRERQILAGLTHPHIARLLDGGIASDGRPYYVMEFVDGQPITAWCDQHRLSIDQRLSLVRTVCLAVEHAHRNLVVHRDLKPSNILVTADGQPKLLDFGIAKLLSMGERDAPATTLTQAGGRLLTPEYAAPEQFRGGPFTTSTDVYSVGAVLYELLTGERPFPGRSSVEDRLGNLEEEPPVVSSRVPQPEQRRHLVGDLDVIVATALRAAPERRYASMEGLREDLRRHQERLPVKARPDTLGYRASRFAHRHRTSVIAAAVVTLMVMLFAITATLQAVRIRRQSEQLEVERDRARHEATTAGAVTDFLVEVFRVSDPQSGGQGETVTARELLDRGADRIETGMSGQPELQASMLGAMGRAYANLEQRERAESLLQRGVELWRSEEPGGSPALVAALQHLAELRIRMRDHAGAEESLREALAIQVRIDSSPARRWPLYVDLASSLHGQGVVDRARAAADTALTLYRSAPQAEENAESLGRLADLLLFTKQWDEVEAVYARLVSLESRSRGPRSAAVALLYNKWAAAIASRGKREAADSLMRISLAIHRELDPRSIGTARTLGLLAANALHIREYARAESLYREALEIQREQLGDQHPAVAGHRATLADALRLLGRYEEAITEYRRALDGYRRAGGPALALVSGAEWRLAVALRDGGRPVESLSLFGSAIADFERRYPPDFLTTAQLRREYALALVAAGRGREAEPMLRRAIEVLDKRYGDSDSLTQRARALLDSLVRAGARRPA